MSFGSLFVLIIVVIAGILGIMLIVSQNQTVITDTYGATFSNETNATRNAAGNLTGLGPAIGGGALILLVVILFAVIAVTFVAFSRKN
jgi:uncharacterized protein (UPF0333 family)